MRLRGRAQNLSWSAARMDRPPKPLLTTTEPRAAAPRSAQRSFLLCGSGSLNGESGQGVDTAAVSQGQAVDAHREKQQTALGSQSASQTRQAL